MSDRPLASGPAEHEEHDPELIAALLDPDQPTIERAVSLARVEACPHCATLYQDLLAVAKATTNLPVIARPRDFSLTPETAARLSAREAGEPVLSRARLTGEMPATQTRTAHLSHDRLLIANLVDRSVGADDRARGEAQLAACRDCAQLLADLLAISEATRSLPVPARPREFVLSPADAQRLRDRGWRRILSAIGSSRDMFTRPLAVGLTTLGMAGLLVATIPGALTGNQALTSVGAATGGAAANRETAADQSSAAPSAAAAGPAAAEAAAPSTGPEFVAPAPAASIGVANATDGPESDRLFAGIGESSPLAGEPQGQASIDLHGKRLAAEAPGPSPLVLVALVLLLVGLGLFALRWTARRLGDG